MAAGDMIFLFQIDLGVGSASSWVVPTGVTAIKVECFGSSPDKTWSTISVGAEYPKIIGGSYSQTSTISVTPGSTVYLNVSTNGGGTWVNKTSNAVPTSTVDGCLAVGSLTAANSQVANNIGDIKYAGGDGIQNTPGSNFIYGGGGNAGPNGSGANAGERYTNTTADVYYLGNGGGANGGISGGLGSIPYGRSSGDFGGNGGYFNGSAYSERTRDVIGQAQYVNGLLLKTPINYGPLGGGSPQIGVGETYTDFTVNGQTGFIVITVIATSRKTLVFSGSQAGSFTIPSDFGSLVSIGAFGAAGQNLPVTATSQGGGGGGAGYSETTGASITNPMVAGSTLVYYNVAALGGGTSASSWINIGINAAPSAVTSGVSAFSGGNSNTNTGGAGGSTISAIGTTKFAGGTGGAGFTSTRYNGGGGGGSGGPSGAGAAGGAAFNSSNLRGGGGGGGSNGGSVGNAGLTAAGGAGGSITGGSGGTGATAAAAATAGTNGGGSGGGFAATNGNPPSGSILNNGLYLINGGTGGKGGQTGIYNSGGNGGAGVYYSYTVTNGFYSAFTPVAGDGLVVFTYNAITPVVTTNSNFFFLF